MTKLFFVKTSDYHILQPKWNSVKKYHTVVSEVSIFVRNFHLEGWMGPNRLLCLRPLVGLMLLAPFWAKSSIQLLKKMVIIKYSALSTPDFTARLLTTYWNWKSLYIPPHKKVDGQLSFKAKIDICSWYISTDKYCSSKLHRDSSRDGWIEKFIKRKWSSGLFWAVGAAEKKNSQMP